MEGVNICEKYAGVPNAIFLNDDFFKNRTANIWNGQGQYRRLIDAIKEKDLISRPARWPFKGQILVGEVRGVLVDAKGLRPNLAYYTAYFDEEGIHYNSEGLLRLEIKSKWMHDTHQELEKNLLEFLFQSNPLDREINFSLPKGYSLKPLTKK